MSCYNSQEEKNHAAIAIGKDNFRQVNLPASLNEISGLVLDDNNNLFAHNDEKGIIFQLDKNSGKIIKKYQLGRLGIEADFEAIATAGNRFFLLESNGTIYEFVEGGNNDKVDIKKYNLNFSSRYEFEGLCYDKKNNGLLLACKEYQGKKYKDKRPVFLFSLKSGKVFSDPLFVIDNDKLKKEYGIKDFYPSGIAISPLNDCYYILSSKGEPCIVVLSPEGKIIAGEKLSKKHHQQPEAIAFLNDGTMVIGDEKVHKHATLSFYSVPTIGKKNGK
jgi:uncharacterized protein YjiK